MTNKNQPLEIWKDIAGYEGYYQVSDLGRVRSVDRIINRVYKGNTKYKGGILKHNLNHKGYPVVYLSLNSKKKTMSIHRLVALAFIPNPFNLPEVNHIGKYPDGREGNKLDNRPVSLKWCTGEENLEHARKNKLFKSQKGELNPFSKLKNKDVLIIRNSNLKLKDLSEIYNVSKTTISDIKNNKIWKHI